MLAINIAIERRNNNTKNPANTGKFCGPAISRNFQKIIQVGVLTLRPRSEQIIELPIKSFVLELLI